MLQSKKEAVNLYAILFFHLSYISSWNTWYTIWKKKSMLEKLKEAFSGKYK